MNTQKSIAYQALLEDQADTLDLMKEATNPKHPVPAVVIKQLLIDSLKNTMDACLNDYDQTNPVKLFFGAGMVGNKCLFTDNRDTFYKPLSQRISNLPKSEQLFYQTWQIYIQPTVANNTKYPTSESLQAFDTLEEITSVFITEKAATKRLERIKMLSKNLLFYAIDNSGSSPNAQIFPATP